MEKLLRVRKDDWEVELEGHRKFFETFDARLSPELWKQFHALEERLQAKVAA